MTTIDFARYAEKARGMTDNELFYAIMDCVKAAESMDTIDRTDDGDRAGRYRDESSVYRAEQARRRG